MIVEASTVTDGNIGQVVNPKLISVDKATYQLYN